jgi:hypothetical protein
LTEHNRALGELTVVYELEFWFVLAPAADIAALEKRAIRALQPMTNVMRYAEEGSHAKRSVP